MPQKPLDIRRPVMDHMFPQTLHDFYNKIPRYPHQNTIKHGVAFTLAKKQVNITSGNLRPFLRDFYVCTLILTPKRHKKYSCIYCFFRNTAVSIAFTLTKLHLPCHLTKMLRAYHTVFQQIYSPVFLLTSSTIPRGVFSINPDNVCMTFLFLFKVVTVP